MIRDDVKTAQIEAMKAKDKERTAATRAILAKIKDRDLDERWTKTQAEDAGEGYTPPKDDDLVTQVLQKMAKQRRESIGMYEEGGRTELAEQEKFELSVIEEFLPAQLSNDEVAQAIADLKAEIGAESMKDMGRLMAALKERHGHEMDMSKASAMVKAALS